MTVRVRTLDELLTPPAAGSSALSTQEYFVNMGPQHPIAHGSLRLVLRLDGETVKEVIPVPGFVHRGIEKMCEKLNPRQIIHLTDRLDYLSAVMNNWGVAKAVEKAANIETNGRIETIRTLMSELQRLNCGGRKNNWLCRMPEYGQSSRKAVGARTGNIVSYLNSSDH